MRAAGLIVLALALPAAAEEATYVMQGGQMPVNSVSNGHVQTVTVQGDGQVEVHVTTNLGPIGAEGAYQLVRLQGQPVVPDGFLLPPSLAARLRPEASAWAAATEVVEWVMTRVRLDTEDRQPQDAASVLKRRRGRCSGLANATTALLLAAGFDARTVSGLLVSEEGLIPHRWVQCRLPGAGWVPTDPTLALWAITPRHVAFADAVQKIPEVTLVDLVDNGLGHLPFLRGRPLRPNTGSDLVCRLVETVPDCEAVAILHGGGGEPLRARLDPEGRFTNLLPGRWKLVVKCNGKVVSRRELLLKADRAHSIAVHLPERGPNT